MKTKEPAFSTKLKWSLPWLTSYPFWRAEELWQRAVNSVSSTQPTHLVVVVANHFEPGWDESRLPVPWDAQMRKMDRWIKEARLTGRLVRDCDGKPFVHTYFYPGEQYYAPLLDQIATMEAEGLGEVEIHLHHGVDKPDTSENLRRALTEFRDLLAEEHGCLSRVNGKGKPMYAFVHGNLALANSLNGHACGVDDEMQILAETGCYADLTLPAVPHQAQGSRINAIYQCGRPLHERAPHLTGPQLRVGQPFQLPVIFPGPLVFNWRRRKYGLPIPRVEDGALTANYPLESARLRSWRNAHVGIVGRPNWVFIKLYCHGFFSNDLAVTMGEPMRRFWGDALAESDRRGDYKIHFATAREAFNMMQAAIDGQPGEPGQYRDYRLQQIRHETGSVMRAAEPTLSARRA